MALEYVVKDRETVDLIVWRHYGRQDNGIVEQVLAANAGVSDIGPELPAGLRLTLPDIQEPAQATSVRLWD